MKLFKLLITAWLCGVLLFACADPPAAEAQAAGALVIIGCAVIASCIIIKAMSTPQPLYDRVLVLETSVYDGHWTPIATNFHATLLVDHPTTIFAPQMTDDLAMYRVRDITEEWRKIHPYNDGLTITYRPEHLQKAVVYRAAHPLKSISNN